MPFDRTKKSSAGNTEADAEEDLKDGEETPEEDGHSENNEEGEEGDTSKDDDESEEDSEESPDEDQEEDDDEEIVVPDGEDPAEFWKARAIKERQEKENYKKGLISKKAGDRNLQKKDKKEEKPDVNEAIVNGVLEKKNEREVLKNVINSKHQDYIPELVDDDQYAAIIGYLPRNLDKSNPASIVKALKLATKMWKEDNGIVDKAPKKKNDLHVSKSGTSGGSQKEQKSGGRKILKTSGGPETWYTGKS